MKTARRVPLKKENSTDNYYKDSLKPRPISFSPKKTTTSQSRIPLPKIPKTKPENLNCIIDTSECVENEIESKLRLKLKPEYIQRYHSLQNKYDNEINKSSDPLHTSFINTLTNLFSAKQQKQLSQNNKDAFQYEEDIDSCEYEYEYEYEYQENNTMQSNEAEASELKKLKKEIENQKQKQKSLRNEIEKNNQTLLQLKADLSESLKRQNLLQNDQQSISNQIGEAYNRNSNLLLELNAMKEQKQFEIQFNELPDSFDGEKDQNESKCTDQITQESRAGIPKLTNKTQTRINCDPTSISSQNQTYVNSFENTSQPLINLSYSTDSEEDPVLFNMRKNNSSNNNTGVDSLDEDSLDDDNDSMDNYNDENDNFENDDDDDNYNGPKTEYNYHVEDYIMTDEEVLTYTTKYEEQKQFTLETMMETQEESTTIVETFELKPNDFYIEEEEEENDDYDNDDISYNNDNKNPSDNTENNNNDDDLNSNGLPKELFRSPYRIKIPIRPPKKL